jgi:hypothetical protein
MAKVLVKSLSWRNVKNKSKDKIGAFVLEDEDGNEKKGIEQEKEEEHKKKEAKKENTKKKNEEVVNKQEETKPTNKQEETMKKRNRAMSSPSFLLPLNNLIRSTTSPRSQLSQSARKPEKEKDKDKEPNKNGMSGPATGRARPPRPSSDYAVSSPSKVRKSNTAGKARGAQLSQSLKQQSERERGGSVIVIDESKTRWKKTTQVTNNDAMDLDKLIACMPSEMRKNLHGNPLTNDWQVDETEDGKTQLWQENLHQSRSDTSVLLIKPESGGQSNTTNSEHLTSTESSKGVEGGGGRWEGNEERDAKIIKRRSRGAKKITGGDEENEESESDGEEELIFNEQNEAVLVPREKATIGM